MSELPAWFGRDRQERNDRSRRQEERRAEQVGGRTTPGSGSSWRSPGDVRADDVLEELKYTDKGSYTLRIADWFSIKRKALKLGREPRMVIDFPHKQLRLVITEEPYDG